MFPVAQVLTLCNRFLGQFTKTPIVFWAIAALVTIAVLISPVYLVIRTLADLGEAVDLLFRSRTAAILGRSLLLVLIVTAGTVIISVPLAWATVRTNMPFRRLIAIVAALPLVIPSYIGGFLFVILLGPKGMLQDLIEPLGVDRLPEIYGLGGASFTLILLSYPYVFLPVRAALTRLDPSFEEISRSLGQGHWRTFIRVIAPALMPSIAGGAMLVALYTLSDFGAVSLMQYETFTWAIYLQYGSSFDRGVAAGFSLVIVILTLLLLGIGLLRMHAFASYRPGTRTADNAPLLDLKRAKWGLLAICTCLILIALILPISVLIYWLLKGLNAQELLVIPWRQAWNSISIALAGAFVTGVVAIPIAYLSVRLPSRLTKLLENATYVGFALPGIAVALGLVYFVSTYLGFLYQTNLLLVFAYVILFLSPAVGTNHAALLQFAPRLEEAARGLGKTVIEAFTTVTLPLISRGALTGMGLVFVLIMKELPATLILSPIGFTTLATDVWASASEAFYTQAAVSSLILLVVTAIPMTLLTFKYQR